jgi:hypothetical protein
MTLSHPDSSNLPQTTFIDSQSVTQAISSQVASSQPTNSHFTGSQRISPTAPSDVFQTVLILRTVGYGLLLLSSIDLIYVIVPPDLTNPVWEYQTVGDLVKLIPVPLLAFMLVFQGDTIARSRLERHALRLISWVMLIIGIFLLLLIPLTIADALRINQFNNDQISIQVNQQQQQLEATKSQLQRATPDQLQNLVPVPDRNGKLPDAPKSPEEAKTQILKNIARAKDQANTQAIAARANLRRNLLKNTFKLAIESLIGGVIFIYIWSITAWARNFASYTQEASVVSPLHNKNLNKKMRQLKRLFSWKRRSRSVRR